MNVAWHTVDGEGVTVLVKAQPRAKTSEIIGVDASGGWVRVRLQAPPVDGRANAALIELFSEAFNIPRRAVVLVTGDTSRIKRIKLMGVTEATVLQVVKHD